MRPITPRMRAELGAPDNPHRALLEAQAEQHSSSKKTKVDFQTADTFVARTADFTASNALTAAAQTVAAALASAPAANALYEAHYSVSIKTTVPASNSNTLKITIAVETDPTGVGSWTEQWARDYELTRKVGEPKDAVLWHNERLPVRVTGFNASGQLRLKIKAATGPGTFSVHGFNLATNADPSSGVTYHTGPAVDFLDSGQGVTLADTVVSKISHTTSDGYETDVNGPPLSSQATPFIVARVVWGKDDSKDIVIDRIKAFLNPCIDGVAGNKNVAWFLLQPYALLQAGPAGTTQTGALTEYQGYLAPLADPIRVPAGDGISAQDYTFSWHERDVQGPAGNIITLERKPRPKSIQPNFFDIDLFKHPSTNLHQEHDSSPTTFIFVWALQADGSAASNCGWGRNSAVNEVVNGSRKLRAVQIRRIVTGGGGPWYVEAPVKLGATPRPVFRMEIQCGSYAAANLEFTGANLLDLGAAPTETVEFVGVAAAPSNTGSVFEVRNDADLAWLPFTDGQTAAEVGVSQRQTYKVRWRASPNTETDGTPTLFEIGVRDVKRVWLSDIATVKATWSIPDVAELVPAIPEAEIVVQKSGEQDFLDRITVLLSENYVGSLMFRVWVGDISRPRSEWMHKDDFVLVDDYDPRAADVTVLAHSPLVLLNGALPVYNTTTQQRPSLRLANKTPSQVWDEIIGVHLATDVPVKYRGDVSALGSSSLLTKNITDSDGKTELDAIAHIAGCVLGSTRGKIAAFDMFTPGGIKAVFSAEKIKWRSTSPGLRQRSPELFAKYGYQDETQNYLGETRVITVDANTLTRMGGTARIDADRNLRDAVCRWLPTERIAKDIGQRRVNALGTGMLLWRFTSDDPFPELEFGDRVAVETSQFMARDPTLGTLRALKGALWAIGRVVEYDVEGKELAIWIQGYADILGAGSSAAVRLGLGLPGPLGQNFTQMLLNPGFEDGNVFVGYSVAGGSGSVVTDSTSARSGNRYLQLSSVAGQFADAWAANQTGAVRYFEVSPGDVVQFGGYAYRESGTSDVYYVIQTLDKDLTVIGTVSTPAQNTAAWVSIETQYIVPTGIKYVALFREVNHSGTATVARFDDNFLRMAVADSTVLNPQGSVAPTAIPANFFSYASAGPTGHMWLSWGWISTNVTRADGSVLNIPAPPAAPAAPTLGQVAGGALAARTRWARIAYVKSRRLYPVSAESSFAISINNLLKVTSPADPGGGLYDGWAVLVGSAANGEIIQSNAQVFGVDWTESVGGFVTTLTPWSASWKSITSVELGDNVTVYEYGGHNLNLAQMRIFGGGAFDGPSNATSDAAAAKQNADGMVPLSFGAMTAIIPVGGSSGGGNGGGKF